MWHGRGTDAIHYAQFTRLGTRTGIWHDLDFFEPTLLSASFVLDSVFLKLSPCAGPATKFPATVAAHRGIAAFLELRLQSVERLRQLLPQKLPDELWYFGDVWFGGASGGDGV
jgi:hypothetical protein